MRPRTGGRAPRRGPQAPMADPGPVRPPAHRSAPPRKTRLVGRRRAGRHVGDSTIRRVARVGLGATMGACISMRWSSSRKSGTPGRRTRRSRRWTTSSWTAVDAAHDWSGRDLMAHLLAWQSVALDAARELAVDETGDHRAGRCRLGDPGRRGHQRRADGGLGGPCRWSSCGTRSGRSPASCAAPDRRARDPLAQARRSAALVPRRDDRPLRGTRRGSARDPGAAPDDRR